MSQPYVGEIRMFGGNFAIAGWAFCDGSLLPISENDVLFNLIGTTYGGDGQETFGLPDLRGRMPNHQGILSGGSTYTIGQRAGAETVTLNIQQIPQHIHIPAANSAGGSDSATNNFWGGSTTGAPYNAGPSNTTMAPTSVLPQGGSQPHDNMQPYLVVNYIISLFGVYPTQN